MLLFADCSMRSVDESSRKSMLSVALSLHESAYSATTLDACFQDNVPGLLIMLLRASDMQKQDPRLRPGRMMPVTTQSRGKAR
jgi:hypothetical protein